MKYLAWNKQLTYLLTFILLVIMQLIIHIMMMKDAMIGKPRRVIRYCSKLSSGEKNDVVDCSACGSALVFEVLPVVIISVGVETSVVFVITVSYWHSLACKTISYTEGCKTVSSLACSYWYSHLPAKQLSLLLGKAIIEPVAIKHPEISHCTILASIECSTVVFHNFTLWNIHKSSSVQGTGI